MHLIQGEPVTEQSPALRQLGGEHGQRMFLDLLLRSVEPPATGIAVSPLRTDDHVRGDHRSPGPQCRRGHADPAHQPGGLSVVAITAYWQHVMVDDRACPVVAW